MKGIIMAGGEGTRLRPLTCDCPKPMIRLLNQPLIAHAVDLLKRHGIDDIAVTLGYQSDAITTFFEDGRMDISPRFYTERTPLGTAGGVKQAEAFLDETFIVLSGDGVTDLDISSALHFHREHAALATLVLKRADNPLDYGVVDVVSEGRVHSFHEKPDWSEVLTDTVNTGIYILEPEVFRYIPENRPCDFGHELFPRLVRDGLPVYGYVTDDYWCDVGDARAYLRVHIDAMEGRIHLPGIPAFEGRVLAQPGAVVDRAAVLEGPCFIECGSIVRAGAHIGPYTVIGANCEIGKGASVKRGILWPGARLCAGAQVRGGVLAPAVSLGEDSQIYEESIVGTGSVVEARGVLVSGAKLWPGKRVAEGERLDANRVWGSRRECAFRACGLSIATPAEAARAAQAIAAAMEPRELLIGHADNAMAEAVWHAAAAGAMAQGAQVIDIGACTLPLLRHAQRNLRTDGALFIDDGTLTPLNTLGATLTHRVQSSIIRLNDRQDFARPALDVAKPVLREDSAAMAYVADATGSFTADSRQASPIAIYSPNHLVLRLAEQAFLRAGLSVRVVARDVDLLPAPGELGIAFDETGEHCSISDEYGGLTDAQHQLLIAWVALECGESLLILPDNATRGIDALLTRYDADAERVAGERALWMNALAERQPFQFRLHFDGLILAICALSLLTQEKMTLTDWRRAMPEVFRRSRATSVPVRDSGRILHAFAQANPDAYAGGGVRLERDGGWAWMGLDGAHPRLSIVAEGKTAEFANELCDFCESQIKQLSSVDS